jgi:DNA (cytosine-5)-methyltransferase 1
MENSGMVLPKYSFHLFAGAGGGIIGDMLLGGTVVGAVELETYPQEILFARQKDKILPQFPIWDDITTFRYDNPECREYIDRLRNIRKDLVVAGGFPCQDISAAGKGEGITGERSGLWSEMFRVVCEIRPRIVFVENSSMLTSRGLHRVLGDLAEAGYDAEWQVLGADDVGANHRRKRSWILAYAN